MQVWLYWPGCHPAPTPRCDPTTARHGDFWLLGFPPGPVRPSLGNLVTPDSPRVTILMVSLVRTPSQRGALDSRTPGLKPSSTPGHQVADLQEYATTPGRAIMARLAYLSRWPRHVGAPKAAAGWGKWDGRVFESRCRQARFQFCCKFFSLSGFCSNFNISEGDICLPFFGYILPKGRRGGLN